MVAELRKPKRTRKSSRDEAQLYMEKCGYIDSAFHKLELLGEGTYGVVYKAQHIPTGRVVALKKLRWENADDGIPATSAREICLLKELRHPCIVNLLGVHHEAAADGKHHARLFLEFEYVDLDLRKFAKQWPDRRIPLPLVKNILYQILVATAFCHTHRTMHRDLKPCNILLSVSKSDAPKEDQGTKTTPQSAPEFAEGETKVVVKLADFGLARNYSIPLKPLTHEVVTLWYRAPEILLGMDRYSTAVDVFSIGVILLELLHGRPPFAGDCEVETLFKMFELLGTPTQADWAVLPQLPHYQSAWPRFPKREDRFSYLRPNLCVAVKDLLNRLLQYDPARRITAKKALLHPWFDDVDKSAFPTIEDGAG